MRIAQDNFRMMTDEIDRHPDLDTTEGIIRVMSNAMLNALVQAKPEDWQSVDMEKLIGAANSLVRVASQKKRVEMQNMSKADAAFNELNSVIFRTLARRYPELDAQLREALEEMKEEEREREEKERRSSK